MVCSNHTSVMHQSYVYRNYAIFTSLPIWCQGLRWMQRNGNIISPFLFIILCMNVYVCMYVCPFVRSHISKIFSRLNFTRFSVHVTCYLWPWLGPPLTTMQYVMHFLFFADDVMFCHNGRYGAWHWQHWRGRLAEGSSQNFQRIRQDDTTLLTLSSYTMAAIANPERRLMSTIALFSHVSVKHRILWQTTLYSPSFC